MAEQNLDDISQITNNLNNLRLDSCTMCHTQLMADAVSNLPCKAPQTSGETEYNNKDSDGDDGPGFTCTDTINVSNLTYYSITDSSLSDSSAIWESVTISETSSEASKCEQNSMSVSPLKRSINAEIDYAKHNGLLSPKRNHNSISLSSDSDSIILVESSKTSSCTSIAIKTSPTPNNVITTRSGRTVRTVLDNKFEYSSEQCLDDDDLDDVYNDDDTTDEDYTEADDQREHTWSKRKRRAMLNQNSCSSSDVSSSLESELPIYLDLSKSTALVCCEPLEGTAADNDAELKISVQKFLGLVAAKRRLYNPMDEFTVDESPPVDLPKQCSFIGARSDTIKTSPVAMSVDKVLLTSPQRAPTSSTPMSSFYQKWLRKPLEPTLNEIKTKELDDLVQRVNANCIENETPEHIKEPIDFSALPSETQRATICRTHKPILLCLEQHPRFYSFIESLSTETPINMCHPSALTYRQREFSVCKKSLATTLFNIFNHNIFHCGLQQMIEWKRSMKKVSSCLNNIESGGQRVSRIILSDNIKHIGVLVKAILHEMCHAAAFVYHGETGHGDCCRKWAYQAKTIMPEVPLIGDCVPTFKYVCCLCQARSYGDTKFEEEATKLRCNYCQFEVAIERYSGDFVQNLSFTHQQTSAYKDYIKQHYMKAPQETHSAKMKSLNELFLANKQTE